MDLKSKFVNKWTKMRLCPILWADTLGRHSKETDEVLHSMNVTPIYIDGIINYCDSKCIHRELLS